MRNRRRTETEGDAVQEGDAFIAFEDFIAYGNSAFAACMLARDERGAETAARE